MFVAIAALIGALIGAMRARKAGGKTIDIIQYAAAHGVMFAIIGLFVNIALIRLM